MVTMGIIELELSEKDVERLTSKRNSQLSALRDELSKITKDKYFFDITSYVIDEPENVRMKRAKTIATEIQNTTHISTKALQTDVKGKTVYVLSIDKKRKIEQPKWLKGKQKKKAEKSA